MPDCIDCISYDATNKCCIMQGRSLARQCINTIIQSYCINFKDKNVLEVGCGHNKKFRKAVRSFGGIWHGIDPHRSARPTHKDIAQNVGEYFDKGFFDIIYAGQTMEHWADIPENIKALYSVLKPNGYLYINVPIYSHGNKIFKYYDEEAILECLNVCKWEIELEKWRYNYEPLVPYVVKKRIFNKVSSISSQDIPSIWILEIRLKKFIS